MATNRPNPPPPQGPRCFLCPSCDELSKSDQKGSTVICQHCGEKAVFWHPTSPPPKKYF